MRQSDLTFFILSFIDDLVQLPITQPAPVDNQSHPVISSNCSNLPSPSALWSCLWLNLPPLFPLPSCLLRGPAQARALKSEKTSQRVPCWLPVISLWHQKQIKKKNSSNPYTSNPDWLHPPLCDPKACVDYRTKQHEHRTKPNKQQHHHVCLC